MSVVVIIGIIFAIAIAVILINLVMKWLARGGMTLDPLVIYTIWALALIFCLFIIAWALDIPIPFFRWR